MDNLLINLIGMGNQGGTSGTTSPKDSSGVESNQKGFINILTNILSESNNQKTLLNKLSEIQESGESGLAYVMSSISNILLSMIPPEAVNTVPEITGQNFPEVFGDKSGQEELTKSGIKKEEKNLGNLSEQINYSALQKIFADIKSGKTDNESIDKTLTDLAKENEKQMEVGQVEAFQEELMKLLSYLNSKLELSINDKMASFQDKLGKIPIQNIPIINIQQTMLEENSNTDKKAINTTDTSTTTDIPTKEIAEKNSLFLNAILEKEANVNRDSSKNTNLQEDNDMDGLFQSDGKLIKDKANQSFSAEQGLGEKGGDKTKSEIHTLILNATKKYKEHVSEEANEFKITADDEITNVSVQKTTVEVPQSDSIKTNIFQIKDNNMTFEKGSFTSFVTDRIEKIVDQFSNRVSRMDMIVRLKLDDKETLLVGLRHEGQKVVVDIKASNDGLVNLIQAHKDDIARHLEDKNIYTSIFVQPDGEKNTERQSQRESKKEDKKQEAKTAFINILEATA